MPILPQASQNIKCILESETQAWQEYQTRVKPAFLLPLGHNYTTYNKTEKSTHTKK